MHTTDTILIGRALISIACAGARQLLGRGVQLRRGLRGRGLRPLRRRLHQLSPGNQTQPPIVSSRLLSHLPSRSLFELLRRFLYVRPEPVLVN
jgi:hypothetical protein